MKIELLDNRENLLETIESDSNPFHVGESLTLTIKNENPEFWKTSPEHTSEFKIYNIEHFVKIVYPKKPTDEVKEVITVSIILYEILYPGSRVIANGNETVVTKIEQFKKEQHYILKGEEGLWHIEELEILK